MSDNPISALAMRERAAETVAAHQVYQSDMCAARIRAIPTTFTNAELLAAAMQLPEVRALLDAASLVLGLHDYNVDTDEYECPPKYIGCVTELRAALAPFMKGAS